MSPHPRTRRHRFGQPETEATPQSIACRIPPSGRNAGIDAATAPAPGEPAPWAAAPPPELATARPADSRESAPRTIFIGDIHGCRAEFEALLEAVAYLPGSDRLLLTGDAFTRGPDPAGVWRMIRATGAEMVLGNHETWLLPQLQAIAAGAPPDTLKESRGSRLPELLPHAAELVPWLEALPLAIDEPRFLLVHAGINPETGLAGSTPDELVFIRTWPPTGGIEGPRWHDHIAPGGKLIVFGHDAPGGLVVKRTPGAGPEAGPYLVGLDSGCVFGRELSAYLLEDDRIVQVPARRAWFRKAPP